MMKTLCVAALVLSLSSVCQPASLACEKLLQPVDKAPDLSGRWYVIAIQTKSCYIQTMARVLSPSLNVEFTSKETPHLYDFTVKAKIDGFCFNKTKPVFHENNKIFDGDSNNAYGVDVLQTGCPDCIVLNNLHPGILIFSRRTNITAAELKEFETQAECLGMTKPEVLHSDHDFTNCRSEEDMEAMVIRQNAYEQRYIEVSGSILECIAESSTVMGNSTSMPL